MIDRAPLHQQCMEYLRDAVARRRLVARNWASRDVEGCPGLGVLVKFTFMCPCGRDIVEMFRFQPPRQGMPVHEFMHGHADALLRELESHIEGE